MSNKKKLVIFIPSIEDGGVEKNLYLVTNYLSKYIKNIHLITFDKKKKNKFNHKIKFICPNYDDGRHFERPFKYFKCLILLFKELNNHKNEKIVFSWQANIYAIILCTLLNVKIISRSNSSPSGWTKNIFKNFIFTFFIRKADSVIVNSFFFKKELDKKFNIKSKLIFNPFDFSFIRKQANLRIPNKLFKSKSLKIINVGRMTEQKDQITLIKAVELALKKIDLKLFIIGKGILKNKLQRYIKEKKLSNNIHLLGYQANPFKYIKKADIFVLTSKFEGSPNVLIESQFLKKFIISTDCPTGPREILKNGNLGNLVKIGDFNAISKLLINFKNKKNLKKINNAYNSIGIYDHRKNCNLYLKEIQKYL